MVYFTDLALISVLNYIYKAMGDERIPLAIIMDLSKAFNTLDHISLLQELTSYGIRGPAHQWILTYLTNRPQVTQINNIMSDCKQIECSVSQGSILGPLLFL